MVVMLVGEVVEAEAVEDQLTVVEVSMLVVTEVELVKVAAWVEVSMEVLLEVEVVMEVEEDQQVEGLMLVVLMEAAKEEEPEVGQ